jgi:hypothetical protein
MCIRDFIAQPSRKEQRKFYVSVPPWFISLRKCGPFWDSSSVCNETDGIIKLHQRVERARSAHSASLPLVVWLLSKRETVKRAGGCCERSPLSGAPERFANSIAPSSSNKASAFGEFRPLSSNSKFCQYVELIGSAMLQLWRSNNCALLPRNDIFLFIITSGSPPSFWRDIITWSFLNRSEMSNKTIHIKKNKHVIL